tara:strand:+ start:5005 stop:5412 length:408 start_codon:yes stop_codon:yes gene_type:complete
MSWKEILKAKTFNDLINEVINKLEDHMQGNFTIDRGEYDEEMEGYKDASSFTYHTFSKGDSIEVEPTDTHWEDQDITVGFDINFSGHTMDEDRNYNDLSLRLGSYTGTDGLFIAAGDWKEYDREALELLNELLEE